MTMVPVALVDLSALMQVATAGSTSTTDGIAKAPVVVVPVYTATITDANGTIIGTCALRAKTFKTGSRGYYGNSSMVDAEGHKCTLQVQSVVYHSGK
jgi:hypothetical protein